MPELPEVETVRRGLAPAMEGLRLSAVEARRPDLRWPLPERFAERLAGRRVLGLGRRAKYLLADLESAAEDPAGGEVLVMHLGMSGSFRIEKAGGAAGPDAPGGTVEMPGAFALARSRLEAHDHVVFEIEDGTRIVYNDPRRFGAMLLVPRRTLEEHPLFRGVGPEPLGNAFDAAYLARACAGRATSLKAALLDQKVVAGLGNIYVSEALHRAGLSPRRAAGTLATAAGGPTAAARRLVQAIRDVLAEAIAAGGSTLRDHAGVDGTLGYFQHTFRVYDREGAPCPSPGCRGAVLRFVQNGRATFHCESCQR
ncbi:bifunctional DNA-formamidopyrimidine glycosylase/DNA-(apurinic or apyrimidinic site) lyase [Ancylobacter lacus]|uniref:bifunctional DNA-formamidopyrimidine glycosylase/DNA-(apurinic or apyrimidinic site) lyase n=1 Tax=Ancylobacter lacus TaxID=2579970 RepID=UPI001BCB750A|nr:bifunctional DNA-formamidopyrimidine glycosylase/DNA-(apurinic or apyrimidinic site) lyase [Ancylobacter lacus]MBS7539284.1 bifunctional DNA-formamidopyrimidine glycosylase/DNA-(apurinic or apyrimidinic site) lyase [Ancylobacter lacus]